MAEKSQHNQADDFEARVAEAVESRLAEAIEKHNQAIRAKALEERHNQAMEEYSGTVAKSRLAKVLEKLKASRGKIKAMEGFDCVDRGDYYEVVIKGPFIDTAGRLGVVLRESRLKEDYILLSGVPPITVKYPKTGAGRPFRGLDDFETVKDLRRSIINQVTQTIREAPKEIHAAYRQAYYKAIEEYDKRPKNEPPPDEYEEIEKVRDELLSIAQIKADQIIRDEQIRADQIRASFRKANPKDVGNQSGRVDPQNVNVGLAAMLSVQGTFEESDIEKQISNRQALVELKAKQCIAAAHTKADIIINFNKALLDSKREKHEKCYRDLGEWRKFDEAVLGFKDNLSP